MEDDSQAPGGLAAWYDKQGLWVPPAPQRSTWKQGMPEELPADVILGTEWVAAHATKHIPRDVADLIGIRGQTVVVTRHTHNVMPPRAKHDNARPYFEHLSEVVDNATLIGPSQAAYAEADRRWEAYTPLPGDKYVLTVVGTSLVNPDGEVVSVYVIGEGTMTNRLRKTDPATGRLYLTKRQKE